MTRLLKPCGKIDRAAVMIEAHKRFRDARRWNQLHPGGFPHYLAAVWSHARNARALVNSGGATLRCAA